MTGIVSDAQTLNNATADERDSGMAEMQESWKEVATKAEALGLKLKLHLEQEQDDDHEARTEGDTKAMVDELGRKISDAFDSFGNAAKDPAVHDDVKDIGRLFRDALATTFHAVGAEVSSRTSGSSTSTDAPPADPSPQDAVESGSDADEADGDDS